jgi:DNA ligase-1
MATLFKSLAEFLERVGSTKKRLEIVDLTAQFLKTLESEETEPAVSMILGSPFPAWRQETLEISWSTLRSILQRVTMAEWQLFTQALSGTGDVGEAAKTLYEESKPKKQALLMQEQLTILRVRQTLETVAATKGPGSRQKKERLIEPLFREASPIEAKYLTKILLGEMRTGLHEGLAEQAIAKAFNLPISLVQKASTTVGDTGEVAKIARTEGAEALSKLEFKVSRPVKLMLAQAVDTIEEALETHGGRTAFEYKYDGARVQIHKLEDQVRIFSRRLTDVTPSLPEIVETVRRSVKAKEAILEGEVVAVDKTGQPIPFQHLMRRFKRVHGIPNKAKEIPLRLYLFDIVFLNGQSQISESYFQRRKILTEAAGDTPLAKQILTDERETVEKFLKEAIAEGHEGLMAKQLESAYTPGTRGKRWLKIKPVLEPLDLVITAAEYGYGRRHGWLSNYYLAAREPETGQFTEIGKTFKGLTDQEITDMTHQLKRLTLEEDQVKVKVLPRMVVEVAFNEIQKSPKYKSKMALRFARITRIRNDKTAAQADTIQKVKEIYEKQFAKKGRYKTETQ